MGIRGLARWLLGGFGGRTPVRLTKIGGRKSILVSRLYIDIQQFIHKAIRAIEADILNYEGNPSNKPVLNDDNLIQRYIDDLIDLIKTLNPRDFIGIFFDGIPPISKVVEQRSRRYAMTLAPSSFNRAKITPGTGFMRLANERLLDRLQTEISWLPPEIYISSSAQPGEGEHKLANKFRQDEITTQGTKVIIADDTDVIIMSLLNNFKETYVYIDHQDQDRTGLLSISSLTEHIKEALGDNPTVIHDFCLMVILSGGNDFMPWIQALRDREETLTVMFDLYKTSLGGAPLMKNSGREIVWSTVRTLVNILATREEMLLKRMLDIIKRRNVPIPAIYTKSLNPKTGIFGLQYFKNAWNETIYSPQVSSLPQGVILQKPSIKEIESDHMNTGIEYLKGLSWTLNYMRTGDGPEWFYGSTYPPLLADIAAALSSANPFGGGDPTKELYTRPSWKPLDLSVYLLTVLPRSTSENLFGETFNEAFSLKSGINDLFPRKFIEFGPGEWMKVPIFRTIMPPLSLDRIAKFVDENIDKSEVESNLYSLAPSYRFSRSRGDWVKIASKRVIQQEEPEQDVKDKDTFVVLDTVIPAFDQ